MTVGRHGEVIPARSAPRAPSRQEPRATGRRPGRAVRAAEESGRPARLRPLPGQRNRRDHDRRAGHGHVEHHHIVRGEVCPGGEVAAAAPAEQGAPAGAVGARVAQLAGEPEKAGVVGRRPRVRERVMHGYCGTLPAERGGRQWKGARQQLLAGPRDVPHHHPAHGDVGRMVVHVAKLEVERSVTLTVPVRCPARDHRPARWRSGS